MHSAYLRSAKEILSRQHEGRQPKVVVMANSHKSIHKKASHIDKISIINNILLEILFALTRENPLEIASNPDLKALSITPPAKTLP